MAYLSPADQARSRLIYQLDRSDKPGARELADVLNGCTPAVPCLGGACPICGERVQRLCVDLAEIFIDEPARRDLRGRVSAITIVDDRGCFEPGTLTTDLCNGMKAIVVEALMSLDLSPAFGRVEVSYNEDLTGAVPTHGGVHAHVMMRDWFSKAQVRGLRAAFPASARCRRPVMVQCLDDDEAARFYAFKWEHERRETYLNPGPADGSRQPFNDTRFRKLRPAQAVELALVEHELGFRSRLITHGISAEALAEHFEGVV